MKAPAPGAAPAANRANHTVPAFRAALLCLLLWPCAVFAQAGAASDTPGYALLVTPGDAVVEDVLQGRAGRFEPVPGSAVRIGGDAGATYWLRIVTASAAAEAAGEADPVVLWIERIPLATIRLYQPGTGAEVKTRNFFRPDPGEPLLFGGHMFRLADVGSGRRELLLELRSPIVHALAPRVLGFEEYAALDRLRALGFSAMYAGLLVLLLLSTALFLALRDLAWLNLTGFTAATLLALLALNGHAYAVPGLRVLSGSGVLGLMGTLCLLAASGLLLVAQYSWIGRLRPGRRWLVHAGVGVLLVLAVVGLANPLSWASGLQWVMVLSWVLGLGGCIACTLVAWREGVAAGRAMLVVVVVVAAFAVVRFLTDQGLVEETMASLYGMQYALAGAAFLFGLAQADRLMEFRRLRERARQDKARLDADLNIEQVRRRFVERLQACMHGVEGKDIEWLAFRRLLEAARSLVPQQGSAVIAFGYHGLDLLLAEPLGLKRDFTRLLAKRGSVIKGLCRGSKPVSLPLEDVALTGGEVVPGGQFAVIPLPVPRPGWGGMLVQRESGNEFSLEELRLLAEFAQVAVNAADEATAAMDLRRRAEVDPLTGALNRRAMDGRLQASVERAHGERRPLSVLFVDLDHFKQVNDRYGHAVGDDCLRLASDCIRRHLGRDDLFGRYGGEEFIVVLPDRSPEEARELSERIRENISELRAVGEASVGFTVSIGLASRLPEERQAKAIVERADKALYRAKRGGRNRVEVAGGHGYGNVGGPAGFG